MVDRGSGELKTETVLSTITEVLPITIPKTQVPGIKIDAVKYPMVKTLVDKLDLSSGSLLKLRPTARLPNN
jgi:hypothetical protein